MPKPMRHFLLSLCFCFVVVQLPAQRLIKDYVINNTNQVLTIDPDAIDYSDLESFGNAIGNAKIVMLGEQGHGDAATFLAKSRLIKYLHEKKGFNVLAFESDFWGLTEGWEKTAKNKRDIDSFMFNNPFPIWSRCNTCSNLFYDYIAATYSKGTPLHIAGIDCQLHGLYTERNYKTRLAEIFQKIETNEPGYKSAIEKTLKNADSLILSLGNQYKKDTISANESVSFLNTLLAKNLSEILSSFEIQVLKNLRAELNNSKGRNGLINGLYYFRDSQMADNIEWLSQIKYPNEKIIIWAHSAHISKRNGDSNDPFNEFSMMGDYLLQKETLKGKIYIAGFTSYKGTTQYANTKKIKPFYRKISNPAKGGFENWIPKDFDYAFTDFKQFNSQYPGEHIAFSMKGSSDPNKQHANYVSYWTKIFDGMFFIRTMYGCKIVTRK
jgi:erythromycin esterase